MILMPFEKDTYCRCFGGQIKERGVEVANILIEETRSFNICCVEVIRSRMVVTINIVPVLWNLAPASSSFGTKLPELLRIGGATSESATHANNGDGNTGRGHIDWNYLEKDCLGIREGSSESCIGKERVGSMPTVTLSSGTELGYLMGPR